MYDIYALETPESVVVGLPIAGVGTRFLATLIDTAIIACILVAFAVIIAIGSGMGSTVGYVVAAVGYVGVAVTFLGYYIFFEIIWNGQTPGKRSQRARVIRANGYPVTPFAVVIRNVLRMVDVLPGLYAVGLICMIIDRRSRRVGDLMAGTIVVKEGREGSLASLPSSSTPLAARPLMPPIGTGININTGIGAAPFASPDRSSATMPAAPPMALVGLTREDEALIRDFLRRYGLTEQKREQLAARIAALVHSHVGGAPPLPFQAARYLEQVLAAGGTPSSPYGNGTGWAGAAAQTYPAAQDSPRVGQLSPEDKALIRDFLGRRYSLDDRRRAELAARIASVVHGHIGGDPPYAPETYLEQALANGQ